MCLIREHIYFFKNRILFMINDDLAVIYDFIS